MSADTRLRIGPPAPTSPPFFCPWCGEQIDGEDPYLEHAEEHRDVAPYAHLVCEEYWPAGTAAHMIAEGVTA